jgi:hypothetical protein
MTPAHLESEVLQKSRGVKFRISRQINGFDVFLIQQNLLLAKQENGPI